MKIASIGAAVCVCLPCWAQSPAAVPPSARSTSVSVDADAEARVVAQAAKSTPAASDSDVTPGASEPKVQRTRLEDEGVRVDELRVRGLNRKVVVQSKVSGAPAYEIGTDDDARDLSQDRRTEGRSLWRLLSF
ncbi:MAG: hypothetical protein ABIR94_14325 [Rubrivivax sp.]